MENVGWKITEFTQELYCFVPTPNKSDQLF